MTAIQHITVDFLGWTCDKRDCRAEHLLEQATSNRSWLADSPSRESARNAGWSFWTGRSGKVFCPDHGPSKGTKMHLYTR